MEVPDISNKIKEEAKSSNSDKYRNELSVFNIDLDYKKALIDSLIQDITERKKFAIWIFVFTCIWSFATFVIITFVGIDKLSLNTSVIVTLIGTTTANAFGFFFLVTKYLFNTNNKIAKYWLMSKKEANETLQEEKS